MFAYTVYPINRSEPTRWPLRVYGVKGASAVNAVAPVQRNLSSHLYSSQSAPETAQASKSYIQTLRESGEARTFSLKREEEAKPADTASSRPFYISNMRALFSFRQDMNRRTEVDPDYLRRELERLGNYRRTN